MGWMPRSDLFGLSCERPPATCPPWEFQCKRVSSSRSLSCLPFRPFQPRPRRRFPRAGPIGSSWVWATARAEPRPMRATAPFAFRYQYLAGGANTGNGWANWNPNGDFARFYIQDSLANGVIPVFTYYMIFQSAPGGGSGGRGGLQQPEQHRHHDGVFQRPEALLSKGRRLPRTESGSARGAGPLGLHGAALDERRRQDRARKSGGNRNC